MIQHTVVFTLVHEPGSPAETAFLRTARDELAAVPGVRDFTVHRQVSVKSPGTWQFSMVFADRAAYDAYDAHPAHRAFVADRWAPEVAEFHEYDFVAWDG
ncbi:Dabb family protein [Kineococcus sp. SYSU DK002]|uniref:Dabb family protein n=1 Tax=Kineococcus sp. SYSU DK002 TaxID=3383123 RepID=UPI003D7C4CF4